MPPRSCSVVTSGAAIALLVACGTPDKPETTKASTPVQQGAAQTTAALLAAGDSLYFGAEYDSARATYERTIRVADAQHDSAAIARALTSLGLVAWKRGQFDDSKAVGEQAVALKLRLGLKNDLAKSYNALGLLAQTRGELDEALRRYAEAEAAAQAVRDSGYIAKVRGNRGLVYNLLGDYDRARIAFVSLRDAAGAMGDTRSETNALNNLGMVEERVGDPAQAIAWLTIARERYAKLDYAVGLENTLGQLGLAYSERGEPGRALAYLDSALTIATKNGLAEPEAQDLEIMAELYADAGDHQRALELLHRARILCDSLKMTTNLGAVALAEAHVHSALGNLQVAIAKAREAADLQRAAGARMDELNADLYSAELAQKAGDANAARAAMAAATTAANALGHGTARIKLALGKARLADLARNSRDVLSALEATTRDARLLMAEEQAEIEALRARAYFRLKQYGPAADAGRRAVASLERIRGNLGTGALRSSYAAGRVDVYSDLVITLLASERVEEAFGVADGARGRGLIEHLSAASRDVRAGSSAADAAAARALLRRIDALVARLRSSDSAGATNKSRSADAEGAVTRDLSAARREYEGMVDRIGRVDPASAILGAKAVDLADVRRSLGPNEALVEFMSTETRLLVFVVKREGVHWLEVPVGRSELAERAHLARTLIEARDSSANAPLKELYTKLLQPVERGGFLKDVDALVIVPHAALSYLPFAALLAPDSSGRARYLVERYTISVLPSASALPALRARTAARSSETEAATVLAPLPIDLPATREEAAMVARRLPRAKTALGDDATEMRLRDALQRPAIVHVASHAVMSAESPMFSNVRLAAPRTAGTQTDNNGRLETHEVLALTLRAPLVFLSGCETALGTAWSNSYAHGDDYATLAQAFLFAGAHNVVATLWRIDDRGAAAFADKFYERLDAATPPAALAAAQRALIADRRYALPYYWAAYTVSGSGRLH